MKHLSGYRQKQVYELRLQGLCSAEIADKLGMRTRNVRTVAKTIGMPFTQEEVERSKEIGIEKSVGSSQDIVRRQQEFINERFPGWIWISGKHGGSDYMQMQCKKCGCITKKAAVCLRKKNASLICPVCNKIEQESKKLVEKEAKNKRVKRDQLRKPWIFKTCEECSSLFITSSNHRKYCSSDCRKKAANRKHDNRINNDLKVDSDITLIKLYKRDKGVCWICGDNCDYKDCLKSEKGIFIAGKNYPSIDHVYPLSKGGTHSWENVRLAHFYCNTIKSDKLVV